MWRLQFSLTNLEPREVKVLCQLPQCKAEPLPIPWGREAKHTWHIQNSCVPEMTHALLQKARFGNVCESRLSVLWKTDVLLFSLSHETGFSSSNAQMSSMGWPGRGGSQRTGRLSIPCTCHTVTWIPVFSYSYLPSLPPKLQLHYE